MPRYVDAVPIIRDILEERDRTSVVQYERYGLGVPIPYKHGMSMRGGIRKALRIIETAPTADVEPVRHGRWELVDGKHTKCSACGIARNILREIGWNYCPNCGAKMDLGG